MSDPVDSPIKLSDLTECTQASVLAEAAAQIAAAAAEKAAAAKAKAAEALAKAQAAQAGEPTPDTPIAATPVAPEHLQPLPPAAPKSAVIPPTKVAPELAGQKGDALRNVQARKVTTAPPPVEAKATPTPEVTPRAQAKPMPERTDPLNPAVIPEGASVAAFAREASRAKAHHFRHHGRKPVKPGTAMDPVAHRAGLSAHPRAKRRVISPGLVFLALLMVFFGMYATGNLPQFDQWTDAAVKNTQGHNAQVVGAIVNGWRLLAYGAAGLCVLLILFMIVNSLRARHNADGEYDL